MPLPSVVFPKENWRRGTRIERWCIKRNYDTEMIIAKTGKEGYRVTRGDG